jgi:hypothetical protein
VLRFDAGGQLPPDAVIQSATLELYVQFARLAQVVSVHVLEDDWGEGDTVGGAPGEPPSPGSATWISRFFDTADWAHPGGDFEMEPSAETFVEGLLPTVETWSSPRLDSDVRGWVDDPSTDFGWALLGLESEFGSVGVITSRESPTPEDRPRLVIEFIPEPRRGLLLFAAFAPLLAASRIRSRVRHNRTGFVANGVSCALLM